MSKKKIVYFRSIYTLLKLPPEKRTKEENKEVEVFLAKKARLDAMPHQKCENCGRRIPCPMRWCSSKCRREMIGK